MITNTQLTAVRDAIENEIAWLAVGDNGTAVTGTETQLGNEIKRVPLGSISEPVPTSLKALFDLLDSDGSLTIREIGIVSGGSSDSDTGRLITRILYTRDKTSLESIQFNYTNTVGRA